MKEKLSSVLSKTKIRSFACHAVPVFLLAALTCASLVFAFSRQDSINAEILKEYEAAVPDITQEQEVQETVPEEEQKEPAEKDFIPVGDIRIPHCDSIYYSLSAKTSDFYFENPSSNACYLKVSITRLDTNENIYSSTLISPGKSISGIGLKLSRQASYKAMIKVDAYALDRILHLNSLAMDAVIHAH